MSDPSILAVEAAPCVAIAILVGKVAPFAPNGTHSAIAKRAVPSAFVTFSAVDGDERGDPKNHGGPEKVVHHYPVEHYRHWRAHGVASALLDTPGAFGENLTTVGMTEESICVGDVYAVGRSGLRLQVSQVRQPCWKLNVRFDVPQMAANVQRACRTGWHYRVLHAGRLSVGDELVLLERPHADWTLARLASKLYVDTLDRPALEEIAHLRFLADSLKNVARRRLETASIESWERRLTGVEAEPG
jgi:MOSC domain-containing protein YiiM